ncbi:unnamed protein product [Adineta ricciae]|uniref:Transient receptor ion channel domain-containing protein n=1 Tax=Adineta ricciae TaxID=249248 RepID=A0A813RHZ3_ADIRI|nr:unnamed protein product [Adineta ricciae]CAF0784290.1 unnamed protein product [Adineta ricciae]
MAQRRRHSAYQKLTTSSSTTTYTYRNRTFEDLTDLFIFACSNGNYVLVYKLLEEGEVKADVMNKMGKSVLQLAIENEHYEVVKILLDRIPYEQYRDALLSAIYLDHTNIANLILKHPIYQTFVGGFLDPTDPKAHDDSQFSSDVTPLILAAQFNRLPIVHYLLAHGERIKKPHHNTCICTECIGESQTDPFRQAQNRLSAYRGLASEVYIALLYPDPILQAFQLGHELRKLAKTERYYAAEYRKLAAQLSIFTARLLDNVRGYEELEMILNKTGLPNEEKYENLARFDLAIQYKEKPFVSHSSCQQKLSDHWYAHLPISQNTNFFKRVVFYLTYLICFPFLAIAHYFFPNSKMGSLCQQPNLKFKAYIASYLIFIALIIASSSVSASYLEQTKFLSDHDLKIYMNYIRLIYKNVQLRNRIIGLDNNANNYTISSVIACDLSLRPLIPNAFHIITSIWVIGFSCSEFKQIVTVGLHVYLKVPSNYVDCSMNLLYLFYFIFLYSSIIYTRLAMNTFQSDAYWDRLVHYNTLTNVEKEYIISQTRHVLYWLNADRFYWKSGDLQNLAEAFFAMGNVASICRMCFLLPVIPFVGPLQVMLDYMMIDISKWILIIVILFTSFACALYLIFSYFAVVLQQQNNLIQAISNVTSSIILSNITSLSQAQCPQYFYELVNQSIPLIMVTVQNTDDDSSNGFCQDIDSYPGISYFGQSFSSTLLTTFFSLFGVIGDGSSNRGYELQTTSCYQADPSGYSPDYDVFTSNLGFFIYGLFSFTCVTVLINTLIAMLEGTIEDIDDRADIEWKYARSKLYIEYIRAGYSLPVPLNILPTPTTIMNYINRIRQMISTKTFSFNEKPVLPMTNPKDYAAKFKKNLRQNRRPSETFIHQGIFNRQQSFNSNKKLTYKLVIERVVKRFLLYYKDPRVGLSSTTHALEFKELRNDISALHLELINDIDEYDDVYMSMEESMSQLNETLNEHFDLREMKQYLDSQKL